MATPSAKFDAMMGHWRTLPMCLCAMCGRPIPAETAVVIGRDEFHRSCAVTSAAGIAASVLDGDDSETAHDVAQAAAILAEAARVLASRCGGVA